MTDSCNITMFQVFPKFNHVVFGKDVKRCFVFFFFTLNLGQWKKEVKRNTFLIQKYTSYNSLKLRLINSRI